MLRDISFSIPQGGFRWLLGASGAGKSAAQINVTPQNGVVTPAWRPICSIEESSCRGQYCQQAYPEPVPRSEPEKGQDADRAVEAVKMARCEGSPNANIHMIDHDG